MVQKEGFMKNLVEPIRSKKALKAVEDLLGKESKRNQLIFVFGINTGLRVSDILGLNIDDVKDKPFVEIREKKTDKYKRFPLNKKLRSLIKEYLKERVNNYSLDNEEPLFLGKKHKRLDRSQVYRFLNKACSEVGIIENVGTHTMRKSFGFHFYKQYNDIALLQKILNHSSPTITLRYIGISQDEIDLSYNNFEL
jgi:integrase